MPIDINSLRTYKGGDPDAYRLYMTQRYKDPTLGAFGRPCRSRRKFDFANEMEYETDLKGKSSITR
jgi:hypothetical protein